MKRLDLALLLVFLLLISTASVIAWSPQEDIDLKNRYNFTNTTMDNCPSGQIVQGLLDNGTWNCTSAGVGDITGVTTDGDYLTGGCESGTCDLLVNTTVLNETIDSRSISANLSGYYYSNGSKNITGNITTDANVTYTVGDLHFWLLEIWTQTIQATTIYATTIYEGGLALASKYIELTDTFGGDVSGTYDNLQVTDNVVNVSCENITGGSDTDYCTDASGGGGGGAGLWETSGDWMYPNTSAGGQNNINVTTLNATLVNGLWNGSDSLNESMRVYVGEINETMRVYVVSVNDTMQVYVSSANSTMATFVQEVNATMKDYADGTFIQNGTDAQLDFLRINDAINMSLTRNITGFNCLTRGAGVYLCQDDYYGFHIRSSNGNEMYIGWGAIFDTDGSLGFGGNDVATTGSFKAPSGNFTDIKSAVDFADHSLGFYLDTSDIGFKAENEKLITLVESTIPGVFPGYITVNPSMQYFYDLNFSSDDTSNLLYIDSDNNKIGIKTATPKEEIEVIGDIQADNFLGEWNGSTALNDSMKDYVDGNDAYVSTTTCGGTDKVSAINNVTGAVTCTADVSGGGGGAGLWMTTGSQMTPNASAGGLNEVNITGNMTAGGLVTTDDQICNGTGVIPDTCYTLGQLALDTDTDTDTNVSSICADDQVLLGNTSCVSTAEYYDDTTIPDTDTNVTSICSGAELLLANGSCVPDTDYLDDTTIADTDTNASACAAGELLDGDNNCVDYSAWDYNEADDYYINGSRDMTGSMTWDANLSYSIAEAGTWLVNLFVQTMIGTTAYFTEGYFGTLYEGGSALSSIYQTISGDTATNNTMKDYVDGKDMEYNNSIGTYVDEVNNSQADYIDDKDTSYNNSMKTYVDDVNNTMKNYADGSFLNNNTLQINATVFSSGSGQVYHNGTCLILNNTLTGKYGAIC